MSIVRWYKLTDDTDSIGADSSGNSLAINNVNVVSVTDATYGQVAYFDGTATLKLAQADVPTSMKGGNSRTFSFWMKMDIGSTSSTRYIHSQAVSGGSGQLKGYFDTSGKLNTFTGGEVAYSNLTYTEDTWYNIVLRYDSTTGEMNVFSNASLDHAFVQMIDTPDSEFWIGDSTISDGQYNDNFKGKMLDVRMYDGALSDTEINTLFTDGPSRRFLGSTMYSYFADLTWPSVPGSSTYTLTQMEDEGAENEVVSDTTELSASSENLTPGTIYMFKLYTDQSSSIPVDTLVASTPAVDSASVLELLTKFGNDLTSIEGALPDAVDEIKTYLRVVLTTGDEIGTKWGKSRFVNDGNSLETESGAIVTPFESSAGSGQVVTLLDGGGSSIDISYDETTNQVVSGSGSYSVDESFVLGECKVTVKEL